LLERSAALAQYGLKVRGQLDGLGQVPATHPAVQRLLAHAELPGQRALGEARRLRLGLRKRALQQVAELLPVARVVAHGWLPSP